MRPTLTRVLGRRWTGGSSPCLASICRPSRPPPTRATWPLLWSSASRPTSWCRPHTNSRPSTYSPSHEQSSSTSESPSSSNAIEATASHQSSTRPTAGPSPALCSSSTFSSTRHLRSTATPASGRGQRARRGADGACGSRQGQNLHPRTGSRPFYTSGERTAVVCVFRCLVGPLSSREWGAATPARMVRAKAMARQCRWYRAAPTAK
mmetsp:Transcript_32573/g.80618  ORF Transcript_32573/g.80618 Transcript_32573/m.80618 type:complete len:207 (-) Transcript_32573:664-1284(-)